MSKFNLKKFILEGKLDKNLQQLNENSPGFDNRKFGDPLPTLESIKAAHEAKEKDLEDDSYEVDSTSVGSGKYIDSESLVSLVRSLTPREYRIFANEMNIDYDDVDQMMDFLYNLDDKEAEFLSSKLEMGNFKDLSEEDAVSWKYNNSPARGGTLDLAPRKVGQSIKENIDMDKVFMKGRGDRKVDSKMWSRMDDEHQMDALLTVFKDPDDAEMYVGEKWDDLPEEKNFMTTTIKPLANEYFSSPSGAQKTPRNPVTKDVTSGANKAATIRSMIGEKVFKGLKEQYSTHGGYVELMDLDDHLDNIHYEFEMWSKGPSTEITDIEPAKEDVISYVVDYLRNTL